MKTFKFYRVILASTSAVFDRMFTSNFKEIIREQMENLFLGNINPKNRHCGSKNFNNFEDMEYNGNRF